MKDISEKRLSDYMAEQIADEILSGRIPGGSELKQEELAEAFEASRIPIREAFQIAIQLINGVGLSVLEEHRIGHFLFRFHEEETLRAWKFTKNKLKLRELTPFGVQTTRNLSLT